MILDSTLTLEAVLAGAVAANQPAFHVDFVDYNSAGLPTVPVTMRGALNSTTDVTLLAAPTAGQIVSREPLRVVIYNRDTASVTVTVKTDDGTTERIERAVTLATTESLCFEKNRGWYVMAANGAIKAGAGVSGPTSSTDNAVARWDGTTGTVIQNSAFVVDDTGHVASFGGQIVFPASQAASAGANTLDDYEEGTFTPALAGDSTAGAQTYSLQTGVYTKIGRVVTYGIGLTLSAKDGTTSGNLSITGLPFTVAATGRYGAAISEVDNLNLNVVGGYYFPIFQPRPSGTVIDIYEGGDNVAMAFVTDADFGDSTAIWISGHYQV